MNVPQEVTELTTTSLREAQRHLSRLLERVAQGEQIVITRKGVPVAILSPVGGPSHPATVRHAIEQIRSVRQGVRLAGLSLREMAEEGRL